MFFHNFKYSFRVLFRNRMMIFWTYAFPICLGLFFYLAFSNIEKQEAMNAIDIAVVDDDAYKANVILQEALSEMSDKDGDNHLFNIEYVDKEKADDLLLDGSIDGYIAVKNGNTSVTVKNSGINQTILKSVVEEINQTSNMVTNLIYGEISRNISSENVEADIDTIVNSLVEKIAYGDVNIVDKSSKNMSYTMIEYYTLIAMTALYGGMIGMTAINYVLANMSHKGKRVAVSKASKGKLILSSLCASYIVQMIGMAILFAFTILVIKVDYGTNVYRVMLLASTGCLAGLSIGIATGTFIKSGENVKVGVVLAISMLGSFLSGMMGITMKYIVDKNVPIVNKVNPASMITDGLYALYYYDTANRYWFDVASLLVFSAILIVASVFVLRRQQYDSI